MSGATNRANQLIEGAVEALETGTVPSVVEFVAAHGTNRAVDKQIRQRRSSAAAWTELSPEAAASAADGHAGMTVVLGAHPNGYVREAVTNVAIVQTQVPGVVSMLALRCTDPVPPIREMAQQAISELLAEESANGEPGTQMPTLIVRATQGIVRQAESVEFCPALVMAALDLFATRTGKFRKDRGRDHHLRTLRELDRRAQMLDHLRRRDAAGYDTDDQTAASGALIEFYVHSLAGTPRAV